MKGLILKTLLGFSIGFGALLLFILVFGSQSPLQTEIGTVAPTPRFESVTSLLATPTLSSTNITQEIARKVAKEIIEKNPDGPVTHTTGKGVFGVNPDQLVNETLEEAFASVKIEELRPKVALSDLHIIKSSDRALSEQYFNNINTVLAKHFPDGTSVNWDDPASTNFSALVNAYNNSMRDSLLINVPQQLATNHRSYVELLGALRNTLSLIKNYQIDPARAMVGIEAGDQFSDELATVIGKMNEYVLNNQLVITVQ